MDQAYFVPRQEILKWINTLLNLNVQNIEDLGQGSIYCQLLDAAFTSKNVISMNKVNWKAKFEYECAVNLKHFQLGLDKLKSMKKIDIEKLAKGKYQENWETIQWLKKFIEMNGSIAEDYNPEQRRNFVHVESLFELKKNVTKNQNGPTQRTLKKDESIKRLSTKYITTSSKKKNMSQEKENRNNSGMKP